MILSPTGFQMTLPRCCLSDYRAIVLLLLPRKTHTIATTVSLRLFAFETLWCASVARHFPICSPYLEFQGSCNVEDETGLYMSNSLWMPSLVRRALYTGVRKWKRDVNLRAAAVLREI
jgi:hypothetical protein